MDHLKLETRPGKPYPLGATVTLRGVQFSLVSKYATGVYLQLFRDSQDAEPYIEYALDSRLNRTGNVWHIEILGLSPGSLYMYRVDGPHEPEKGLRFNRFLSLLDPYTRALTGDFIWDVQGTLAYDLDSPEKDLSLRRNGSARDLPKCLVVEDNFDWQGDRPLNYPLGETIVYEAHVRGLSRHSSSGVEHPGTYRGVIEMIPYLRELGITSLELLPIHEFDEFENMNYNPLTGERLTNYWGYSTLAFFAPKGSYAADGSRGEQVNEFKEMVRELHRAGIEVILDVVFNHTGEGAEMGPTVSFRGIDNSMYYMLDQDPRYYRNFSGCGNTLSCNNPVMRTLITDALHYWVVEMHVDGFRFDLASILGRDQHGRMLENPPILERIAKDPLLQDTKVIAEAWDAGGAYQVGWFPGGRWAEWNDRFRDDVRRFWRGDRNAVSALATRMAGSSDLYMGNGRKPFHSINFITSHDGFTLHDLVSYSKKHNEANGENNRDGNDANFSYNYGIEGETRKPEIRAIRTRQTKNFLVTLLLSLGTPMMLSGDEFGRTQKGNNNTYCHNNGLSWNDYELLKKNNEIFRFSGRLINYRKRHRAFRRPEFYTGRDNNSNRRADVEWFSQSGEPMCWEDHCLCLGIYIDGGETGLVTGRDDDDFYMMLNPTKEDCIFTVPPSAKTRQWVQVINTALPSPDDFVDPASPEEAAWVREVPDHSTVSVMARSLVLLQSRVR